MNGFTPPGAGPSLIFAMGRCMLGLSSGGNMSKREHLQFLVLMIPTFVVLVAAAVSMADLPGPSAAHTYAAAADDFWQDPRGL